MHDNWDNAFLHYRELMDNSLYSVAQLRAIEQAAAAALGPHALMPRAGAAAAALALELIGPRRDLPVLLLAGPGNNGGDAIEVAANLAGAGLECAVLYLAGDAVPSGSTAHALGRARAAQVRFVDSVPDGVRWSLAIDGLFGIGLGRPLQGRMRELVLALESLPCPVLALDVPSGLDADTGAVTGPDGVAVRATHTITFIGDKPGLHTGDGRDHAGAVRVSRLDIDAALFVPCAAHLNGTSLFGHRLRPRRHNSHKGSYGDVVVVGGAHGMSGAPVLAARGALYAGGGRVFVAAIDPGPALDVVQPEIMFRSASDVERAGRTLVVGPGMGDSAGAMRLLSRVLDGSAPLVLDADALNLVAASPDLQGRLEQHAGASVLTPHPLEAARLLGVTAAVVQGDRLEAARELAARLQAVVVLKGSGTVVARADGQVAVNPTGNPGLSSAGTGDVLAGVCGALLAQGWPSWEAALGAVWLHGAAADRLVAQGVGPIGMTAGELPAAVRAELNGLIGR
jgi:hydroxyethylthiazole kinase-like uncharacterized protein yjeF